MAARLITIITLILAFTFSAFAEPTHTLRGYVELSNPSVPRESFYILEGPIDSQNTNGIYLENANSKRLITTFNSNYEVSLLDFPGYQDGLPDLGISKIGGTLTGFLSGGSVDYTRSVLQSFPYNRGLTFLPINLFGVGFSELFASGFGIEYNDLLMIDGYYGTFSEAAGVVTNSQIVSGRFSALTADFNNDLLPDVLTVNYESFIPGIGFYSGYFIHSLNVLINKGDGEFDIIRTPLAYLDVFANRPTIRDVNKDGFLDVIYHDVEGASDIFYIFINNGKSEFPVELRQIITYPCENYRYTGDAYVGNIVGDQDDEFFTVGYYPPSSEATVCAFKLREQFDPKEGWMQRVGVVKLGSQSVGMQAQHDPPLVDFDRDGYLDIFLQTRAAEPAPDVFYQYSPVPGASLAFKAPIYRGTYARYATKIPLIRNSLMGTTIVLDAGLGGVAYTDQYGQFQFNDLSPGQHLVSAFLPGYKIESQLVNVPAEQSKPVAMLAIKAPTASPTLTPRPTSTVSIAKTTPTPSATRSKPDLYFKVIKAPRYDAKTKQVTAEFNAFNKGNAACESPYFEYLLMSRKASLSKYRKIVKKNIKRIPVGAAIKASAKLNNVSVKELKSYGTFSATLLCRNDQPNSATFHGAYSKKVAQ